MNRRQKVVVTDFVADALEPEKRILGDLADVVAFNCYNEHDLVGRIEDADAIMLYHNMSLTRKRRKTLPQEPHERRSRRTGPMTADGCFPAEPLPFHRASSTVRRFEFLIKRFLMVGKDF